MSQFRIGLMVGNKTIDYPHSIRMGVQNTLEDTGHLLVAIADLVPYHTRFNADEYFKVAFEIAGRLGLDALIVPAGVVTGYLSGNDEMTRRFMMAMDPKKTLVLERSIPGYRCITKDNAPGMHDCMKHLIEDCGFKKIAFISGPEASQGAREREAIYFEEMKAHGLEVKPEMFVRGLFSGDCEDVVHKLLDDNPNIEAIACACDFIAYTAYHVLRDRKIAVGSDIAITGFDDHPKSAHVDPPLSTVHMTGYDLGCMAAREAIRMCEDKDQQESVVSSRFIARSSCGEDEQAGIEYFRELLGKKPFPKEEIVNILMNATISMAGRKTLKNFRMQMETFIDKIRNAYLIHTSGENVDSKLFSSQDLSNLFLQTYKDHLSLEGFHNVAINLLEALLQEHPDDAGWIISQISYLHLRIARLSGVAQQDNVLAMNKREWNTFHMADDALREYVDPEAAYKSIIGEFENLGVRHAELFLFPQAQTFIGGKTFALSDRIMPVGYISNGDVTMLIGQPDTDLHEMISLVLSHTSGMEICTIGGIMAGNELLGVAVLDNGTLDDNGQLMAFLNMGFALKHLQMISYEREINALLHTNNLKLEQQSMQDEMTKLLNRRGLRYGAEQALINFKGEKACIIYYDLDGLKMINDTYGHDVGDEAIIATADILKKTLPENGVVGRLGGDEFVEFIIVVNDDTIPGLCEKVQRYAGLYNENGDKPYKLSISYGSEYFIIDDDSMEALSDIMTAADEKLYEMKRERKGLHRFEQEKNR